MEDLQHMETFLVKNSFSEQGDLGSACDLGNQQCGGQEMLIKTAKGGSDASGRSNTRFGW